MRVTLEQNSDEWLAWRQRGIGSSDIPAILGLSKYMTARELWQQKIGLMPPPEENFAMIRGSAMEKIALEHYKNYANVHDVKPICVEHDSINFLRASLDGYSESTKRVVEIKCLGQSDNHKMALEGKVPDMYLAQVQYQLMLTGSDEAHYFSFDGTNGVIVPVRADPEYQNMILKAALKFWNLVVSKTEPDLSDRDYKDIDNPDLLKLIDQYVVAKETEDEAKTEVSRLKNRIIKLVDHERMKSAKIKIYKTKRPGGLDYDAMKRDGVVVEKYRKSGSESFTLKVVK